MQGEEFWERCFIHEGFSTSFLFPLQGHLIDNLYVLPAGEIDLCHVSERCLMVIQITSKCPCDIFQRGR